MNKEYFIFHPHSTLEEDKILLAVNTKNTKKEIG